MMESWKILMIGVDVILVALLIGLEVLTVRKYRRRDKIVVTKE